MAKISINDRTERGPDGRVQILPRVTQEKVYAAIIEAMEWLGEAERVIEVITVSPQLVTYDPTNFIEIKIVINMRERKTGKSDRFEQSFKIFCNNNVVEFARNTLISTFQAAIRGRLADHEVQTKLLQETLGIAERQWAVRTTAN